MEVREAVILRIQQLLKEKGWSMNELVRRAGVNQSTVAEMMAGRSKHPGIHTIEKLAYGFGMTLREFFDDEVFNKIHDEKKE